MRGKCAGDSNGPLHPGREIGREQVAHGFHAYHLEQAVDDLENLFFVEIAAFAERKGNVLADRKRVEECAVLEDHGDFFADALHLFRVIGDVLVSDNDTTGIGLQKSHDVVQRNRFADAAAPEDATVSPG